MIIKRIRVGEFGIIKNQSIEALRSKFIVVGGRNRAGKSTLMQVLRNMGYGFPKDASLPKPQRGYDVEFDTLLDEGLFRVVVNGYAQPQVTALFEQKNPKTASVYTIDAFTYRQLFTIDLSQLRPNPENLVRKKDKAQMQSILLGAGLEELTQLPQMRAAFSSEADKLAGTKGRANVGELASYYERIAYNEKNRIEALDQVNVYRQLKDELLEGKAELEGLINEKEEIRDKLESIKSVAEHYDLFLSRDALLYAIAQIEQQELLGEFDRAKLEPLSQLWNEYQSLYEQKERAETELALLANKQDCRQLYPCIASHSNEIKSRFAALSGIEEKMKRCMSLEAQTEQEKQELQDQILHSNAKWTENALEEIEALPVDEVGLGELSQQIESLREAEVAVRGLEEDRMIRLSERKQLSQRQEEHQKKRPHVRIWLIVLTALSAILGGAVFAVLTERLYGLYLGLGGALICGMLLAAFLSEQRTIRQLLKNYDQQIDEVEAKLNASEELLIQKRQKALEIRTYLNAVSQALRLEERLSPSAVHEAYRLTLTLKSGIKRLRYAQFEYQRLRSECVEALGGQLSLLQELAEKPMPETTDAEMLSSYRDIIEAVSRYQQYVGPASEIARIEAAMRNVQERIAALTQLNMGPMLIQQMPSYMERARRTAELLEKKEKLNEYNIRLLRGLQSVSISGKTSKDTESSLTLLAQFDEQCASWGSEEAAEQEIKQLREEEVGLEQRIDALKKHCHALELRIQNMATDSQIEEAQREIDKAREKMRPLAYRYAVLRCAAQMLLQIESKEIHAMQESLLKQSSEIFKQLTSGAYEEILPKEELTNPDFAVLDAEHRRVDSTMQMSRGTMEQLYLAVRLSRIREIYPPLPVIIDDSFVNFDRRHVCQTLKLLKSISEANQVFLFTCHGELVSEAVKESVDAQCFLIDEGKIQEIEADGLVKALS